MYTYIEMSYVALTRKSKAYKVLYGIRWCGDLETAVEGKGEEWAVKPLEGIRTRI